MRTAAANRLQPHLLNQLCAAEGQASRPKQCRLRRRQRLCELAAADAQQTIWTPAFSAQHRWQRSGGELSIWALPLAGCRGGMRASSLVDPGRVARCIQKLAAACDPLPCAFHCNCDLAAGQPQPSSGCNPTIACTPRSQEDKWTAPPGCAPLTPLPAVQGVSGRRQGLLRGTGGRRACLSACSLPNSIPRQQGAAACSAPGPACAAAWRPSP